MDTSQPKIFLVMSANSDIGTAIVTALKEKYPTSTFMLHSRVAQDTTDLSADLSDPNAVGQLIHTLKAEVPLIDWIIYVSGYISPDEKNGLISESEELKTFQINTFACMHLVRGLETLLTEDGGIVAISSTASLYGNGDFPIYAASKAALNFYCKSLKKRWGETRHVYVVCPGGTNTKMRQQISTDAGTQQPPSAISAVVTQLISTPSAHRETFHIVKNGHHEALPD